MATNSLSTTGTLLAGLALLLVAGCQSWTISNPRPAGLVYLESGQQKCTKSRSYTQWYALYGTVPLNETDSKTMFPRADSSYRITEQVDWLDMGITLAGGLVASVTRKTLVVEECRQSIQVASPSDLEARIQAEREQQERKCDERIEELKTTDSESTTDEDQPAVDEAQENK
ncbi:MAG: hypothetical protein KDK39_20235 [Leptospiraceae bacterium]|nr:hypothetical protein [Leptospiraceae bacterium]